MKGRKGLSLARWRKGKIKIWHCFACHSVELGLPNGIVALIDDLHLLARLAQVDGPSRNMFVGIFEFACANSIIQTKDFRYPACGRPLEMRFKGLLNPSVRMQERGKRSDLRRRVYNSQALSPLKPKDMSQLEEIPL